MVPPPTNRPQPFEPETDPRFVSGKWTGFWLQKSMPGRQWMNLTLQFCNGAVTGSGTDRIGGFKMTGTYDVVTGRCRITKAYDGAHAVDYDGRNEGDGAWLWGTWTIRRIYTGGFHIWPEGEGDPTQRRLKGSQKASVGKKRKRVLPGLLVGNDT